MDATEISNLIECPHCGAKLPPTSPDGSRRCEYCESVFSPPPPNPHIPPPPMSAPPNLGGWSAVSVDGTATTTPSSITYVAPTQSTRGCGVGMAIFFVILAASIGLPLYFAFKSGGFSSVFADKPDGNVAVQASATAPQSLFTFIRESGTQNFTLVRLDPPSSTPIWKSASLTGTSLTQAPIITNGTYVMFPNGSYLMAYRVDTGAVAWQAPLSDEVSGGSCKKCLFIAGNLAVIETTDYTYHAVDLSTGQVAWKRKAVTPSAWATSFGDKVLLLDDDEKHDGQAILINADGTESAVKPVCPSDSKGFDADFDTSAAVLALPAENAAVFGYGSPYSCWQRIDFTTGQPAWTAKIPQGISTPRRDDSFILTQGTKAAVVTDGTVASLDLATGDYKPLPKVPDAELYPLAIHENTVVLQTTNTRGTQKSSIHAVDITTGEEAWSVDVGTAKPAEGPQATTSFLSTGDARFIASGDDANFRVVVFIHDTRQLVVHTVPFATGKDTTATVDTGADGTFPYFVPSAWVGPNAVISMKDSGLLILDTTTTKITFKYP